MLQVFVAQESYSPCAVVSHHFGCAQWSRSVRFTLLHTRAGAVRQSCTVQDVPSSRDVTKQISVRVTSCSPFCFFEWSTLWRCSESMKSCKVRQYQQQGMKPWIMHQHDALGRGIHAKRRAVYGLQLTVDNEQQFFDVLTSTSPVSVR